MMKATINGITVEGTPQEIIDYKKLEEQKNKDKAKEGLGALCNWPPYISSKGKCPREGKPCYCTGECIGAGSMDINYTWGKRIYDNSITKKGG